MRAFLEVTTSAVQLANELLSYNRAAFHAISTFSMSYLIVKVPSIKISRPSSGKMP